MATAPTPQDDDASPRRPSPGHGGSRPNSGRKPRSPDATDPYSILAKAKAKNESYKAELTHLEYRQRMGDLIPRDEVVAAWTDQILIAKGRFLALPARLAPVLLGLETMRDIERTIRDAIHDVLDELSRSDGTHTGD